ncbi:hypothetical protein SAMN05660748_3781 [Blastococcus aggregatus]|uniref:Uncharacterized protein n=1 Tax=Blastococcus aggregatus TaxID=38502 RepID=A0A285VER1_9ACTN|nr:hypothetical protein [Blastococcus aggregatus]SOC51596.1 hypothetical protein SAMN05660748_3781 [Blastococcus aggregatus]
MTKPTPAPAPVMPPSVRVAVGVMAVLALLLLASGVLLLFGLDVVVDRITDETDATEDEARRFVIFLSLVPSLVLGAALALAAVFVPRQRGWARWVGAAASGVLVVITIISAVIGGAVSVTSLLLLVLSVAAVTSLMARTTRAWMPGA